MKYVDHLLLRLKRLLDHPRFFVGIIILLFVEAGWIALSEHFPMAFDEDFHLGIIMIYSHHWLPFLSTHPPGADMYGAVTRDPSYLYHYLMSFPYRLIVILTDNTVAQVIILRFMNICLFASSLFLYRKIFHMLGASRIAIHSVLLCLVLIPVVPLLAGQINYDNLFIVGVAGSMLLTLQITASLRKGHFDLLRVVWLLTICLLMSQVKYAFFPVFMVLGVYVFVLLWRFWGKPSKLWWREMLVAARRVSLRNGILVVGSLLVALILFGARDGVNTVRYGTPLPDCSQVLTIKQCTSYGPWGRNYRLATVKGDFDSSILKYTDKWLNAMWQRLYFVLDGPSTSFQTRDPLPVPHMSGAAIVFAAIASLILGTRKAMRRYDTQAIYLSGIVAGVYIAVLFADNFQSFVQTGQPVAINGRYLIPFLPLVGIIAVVAGAELLKKRPRILGLLVVVAIGGQLWGGGASTFILRSTDNWYWPSPIVRHANHAAQDVIGPITPGYRPPAEFLP